MADDVRCSAYRIESGEVGNFRPKNQRKLSVPKDLHTVATVSTGGRDASEPWLALSPARAAGGISAGLHPAMYEVLAIGGPVFRRRPDD